MRNAEPVRLFYGLICPPALPTKGEGEEQRFSVVIASERKGARQSSFCLWKILDCFVVTLLAMTDGWTGASPTQLVFGLAPAGWLDPGLRRSDGGC
ncbi:hypothetical protein MNBD_ALPHA12-178 [hydrothermal vent metagenome]|uniref:Uncharacterized protein n=1 Tax=hydrothermal vent metagenome TaxID=652676 RepID=A0A3B0TQY8_9ZZZZ